MNEYARAIINVLGVTALISLGHSHHPFVVGLLWSLGVVLAAFLNREVQR